MWDGGELGEVSLTIRSKKGEYICVPTRESEEREHDQGRMAEVRLAWIAVTSLTEYDVRQCR